MTFYEDAQYSETHEGSTGCSNTPTSPVPLRGVSNTDPGAAHADASGCLFMFPMVSCVPRAGDNAAPPLAEQTEGGLAREVMGYAPDLGSLTFAHRLIYAADAHLSRAPRPALKCPAPPRPCPAGRRRARFRVRSDHPR